MLQEYHHMKLRIAGIDTESVVDGPGIRFVIFTQGCYHNCRGCHNPQTHDPNGGREITLGELETVIENTDHILRGITFSGGEPFLQPEPLAALADYVHGRGMNLVTYTGYTLEKLLQMSENNPAIKALLERIDLLIDGPFKIEEKDMTLAFRGSRNQRLIDLPATLKTGEIVEWKR